MRLAHHFKSTKLFRQSERALFYARPPLGHCHRIKMILVMENAALAQALLRTSNGRSGIFLMNVLTKGSSASGTSTSPGLIGPRPHSRRRA